MRESVKGVHRKLKEPAFILCKLRVERKKNVKLLLALFFKDHLSTTEII
jgi:hypothetical protein